MPNTLNVALVGCGQIADAHLQEIAKIDSARVVAVCDVHPDLATQAAARFGIAAKYHHLDRMFAEQSIDVVHITTPAHTHATLSIQAMEAGCHVFVEKPFTLDAKEADRVLEVSRKTGRLLCVGHDQLFDPMWIECKRRLATGEIGPVRHVESVLGYPISGHFGKAVTSDPKHWVRQLPGGLFQNTISHPLYRITDLMLDASPAIDAHWHRLRYEFPTELEVHLRGTDVTGHLSFLSTITPQRISRVYGERGMFEVDFDAQTIRRHRPSRLPGVFGKLETTWAHWREAARNNRRNFVRFLKSDLHYFAGMNNLFREFYQSVKTGGPLPIACEEMRRVTALMDTIFDQCRMRESTPSVRHTGGLPPTVYPSAPLPPVVAGSAN